jgi:hypothetical protein
MPWCEECAKYFTPNSVNEDGSCPKCGAPIQASDGDDRASSSVEDDLDEKAPWHFKLMVVTVAVYLGWRFVQIFT